MARWNCGAIWGASKYHIKPTNLLPEHDPIYSKVETLPYEFPPEQDQIPYVSIVWNSTNDGFTSWGLGHDAMGLRWDLPKQKKEFLLGAINLGAVYVPPGDAVTVKVGRRIVSHQRDSALDLIGISLVRSLNYIIALCQLTSACQRPNIEVMYPIRKSPPHRDFNGIDLTSSVVLYTGYQFRRPQIILLVAQRVTH